MPFPVLKPYHHIPIIESGEPLVPIPLDLFAVESPHPYQKLGADYGDQSPYCLRQSLIEALIIAQQQLQKRSPYRLLIFDAYRPVAVQQFMVDYTFQSCLESQGLTSAELSPTAREAIYQQVYQIWAPPSFDPHTPPPHSTGGAVDITLWELQGQPVDLGGAIDELSPRSHPDYYSNNSDPGSRIYHRRRQLLNQVMCNTGFLRHPAEWWHFCLGDQMWSWLENKPFARYGRV
ncbi:M15 family metallopeptidase [Gloeocapsa sp. PCC 73106]|uniref:M15 family metallopeptidase n=1 Tax=Gloeocapsa sp. PCC 73106 TaxID=102232 RepID=UPI0002AC10F1|nr:M15 family metallopeptidase [Gloeocapsa sp. PCC 73106]ELR98150.1 D-alanyl-D-alanine dipeptidase [Gloeocapsa sp. PCC 73106]